MSKAAAASVVRRNPPCRMRHARAPAGRTMASMPATTAMREPDTQTAQPMSSTEINHGRPFRRMDRPMATKSAITKYEPAALRSP